MSITEKELLVERLHNAYLNELVLTKHNPFAHMKDTDIWEHYIRWVEKMRIVVPEEERTVEYMEWFTDMVLALT
jgi:hypothetical protein